MIFEFGYNVVNIYIESMATCDAPITFGGAWDFGVKTSKQFFDSKPKVLGLNWTALFSWVM